MTKFGGSDRRAAVLAYFLCSALVSDDIIYIFEFITQIGKDLSESGRSRLIRGGDQPSVVFIPSAKAPQNYRKMPIVFRDFYNRMSGDPACYAKDESLALCRGELAYRTLDIIFLVIV